MASTKVRGITIELGADASGISKALSGVNKEIGSTQKQLKDVERLLKLDPTNTDLLRQKQELLSKSVSDTSDKLEALKKAQEQVSQTMAETGEGKEQYDALQREIIACEAELRKAEDAANSFNATTAKISATAGKLSQKFGSLADKTKGLSMAAGGALAGLAGLAVKAGKDADDLNTLAKQTGLATDELQKMQYAADLIDVDTDTIVGGIRKLKKNLDGQEETWKRLKVNVKDANGEYRDITSIFYDTVGALSQIENETERDTLAMTLFGKSADELAGVIDDGGAALKELGAQAEDLGVIIPQEDLDRANELNDTLDQLKAEVLPTIASLGVEIADAIMPYIPAIREAIEKVLEALRNISPTTLTIIAGVLALTAAISPLFSVLSGVTGAISALTSGAGALGGVLGGLSAPILAVVAVIGVLVAAFMHLWNTNEEFRNKVMATWDEIRAKFDSFGQGIVDRLNAMGFDFENFSEVVTTIWNTLCDFLAPVFTSTFDAIAAVLGGALDVLTGLFDVFAGLFTGNWEQMWNGCAEIFEGIWDAIVGVFKSQINGIIGFANTAINGLNKIGFGDHKINIPNIPELMAQGGVLTSGSAIVGEAGPEFVQVSDGRAMVQPLGQNGGDIAGLLETYLPYLAERTALYMDSGALVGSIAPSMNGALGNIAIRSGNR